MRRFSTATVLGGLLLLAASGSLAASDAPKAPRAAARRKAVASKQPSKVDVKLDNLYVDSGYGQVFTVNLGRADQPVAAGESASLGSVHFYQLGGSEIEPPATEVTPQTDPADDEEAEPAGEMQAAPQAASAPEAAEAADPDEAMEADESAADPAAAPQAAPQTGAAASQPDPGAKAQAAPAAKQAPRNPPPADPSQTPPPPPPPIR